MQLEWDEAKNKKNREKHGIDFAESHNFPWEDAGIVDRSRRKDGEKRFAAVGWLYGKLYTVIFTHRGEALRIISMRRANSREEREYEKKEIEET